jgi:hypothetical protein
MTEYSIIRFFDNHPCGIKRLTVERRCSLAKAQTHCTDPEASSVTCSLERNVRRTGCYGAWHDGYEEEK